MPKAADRKNAASHSSDRPDSNRAAQRPFREEDWRVFLPEDEPVDPLPENGDFDWEESWDDAA